MFHIDSTIQNLVDLSWFATCYWYGIPSQIDTKVLKLGFYMFLYGLHWVNIGGGGRYHRHWPHVTCFYGSWKLLTPKLMIGICWNTKTSATNSVVLNLAPSFWTPKNNKLLDFPCDFFACWGWSRKFRMLQTMGKSCGKRTPRQLENHQCQAEHHILARLLDIIVLGFCLSASMHWLILKQRDLMN